MDGFAHLHAIVDATGILYAENFDDLPPPAPEPPAPEPEPPPPAPPAITQADVEHACRRAVQQAEADWARSAATRREQAATALRDGLRALRAEAAEQAERTADALARAALSALAAVLPALCERHGDHEVRTLLRTLLPLLGPAGPITVRVHPSLVEPLREDLALLDETLDVQFRPANLPPGDVRLAWPDGSLVRDGAEIRTRIEAALAELGLLTAPSTEPTHVHAPDARPAHVLAHPRAP